MAVTQLSDGNDDGTTLGQSVTDKVSAYNVATIAQASGADQAICTDAASVIVLANAMRLVLVNFGIMKGSA